MIPTGGCALANLLAEVDPIGSATPFDQLFLLQVPPPWPRIAFDSPLAPPGLRQAQAALLGSGRRVHIMFIDGAEPAPVGGVRVMHFTRTAGPFSAFGQSERVVPAEDVASWLVERGSAPAAPLPTGRLTAPAPLPTALPTALTAPLPSASPAMPAPHGGRHLLVCAHGERDGCCGRFGEAAFRYLAEHHASEDLRVWRVSHFGGHRFAPTMLDMPSGRCWGNLSEASCAAIAGRSGDVGALRRHYRGWCALPAPAQVVERELMLELGWRWLGAEVEAAVSTVAAGTTVELSYRLAGRPVERRAALLEVEGECLAPVTCGAIPTPTTRYSCRWTPAASDAPISSSTSVAVVTWRQ